MSMHPQGKCIASNCSSFAIVWQQWSSVPLESIGTSKTLVVIFIFIGSLSQVWLRQFMVAVVRCQAARGGGVLWSRGNTCLTIWHRCLISSSNLYSSSRLASWSHNLCGGDASMDTGRDAYHHVMSHIHIVGDGSKVIGYHTQTTVELAIWMLVGLLVFHA